MTTESSIQGWLTYLNHQRRASAHTISAYQRDIQRFINSTNGSLSDQLARDHLRLKVAEMSRSGLSPRSISRAASALRSFVTWAVRHEYLPNDFALPKLALPKLNKPLPKVIDVDTATVAVSVTGDDLKSLRDRALLEVIYGCGVRVSELQGLRSEHILDGGRSIKVVGKGSKERLVPLGKEARSALGHWLRARPKDPQESTAIFVNLKSGKALSTRGIQHIIKQRGRDAGIDIHLHPHLFRHAFASHILESSGDLRAVQELLGHENLSTTQVYTHLNFQHLADVYDRSHPRAKKND
jgi:integrase/recombinase XerC